jgi:hypothetical protein
VALTASGDCSSHYAAVGTETDSLKAPRPTIRAADSGRAAVIWTMAGRRRAPVAAKCHDIQG